ncbi:iron reductase [Mycena maculata]|uniref:Iron reductase n=1 Tax=Mycena maculata TaxID=230809 RepID=A0AAD7NXN8_9AGAR|nr:iron reductase [Mycena maculata]
MSTGTPPVIPSDLLPYESYTEDPKWQIRFTAMWCAALGLIVLAAAPSALSLRSIRENARGWLGLRVRGEYDPLPQEACCTEMKPVPTQRTSKWTTAARVLGSFRLWTLPGLRLNAGQMFVVASYAAFVLVCIVLQVPLLISPNRAGFLALAQLPPVFIFASKNSPLTALLLGPGVDYTKLNYIHRWSGRGLFLGGVIHGAIWINNHLVWDLPILTQQKEGSGVAALGVLCMIVLTSVSPLRRWCYSAFLVCHYLTFPAFFITICYHTTYAPPWIFPPLAFYGADLLMRIFNWRVVAARIEGLNGGLSLIHIPNATAGWRAGQHVQMRALIGGRVWEAHPLSICSAAPEITCLSGPDNEPIGMLLAARACGDWSRLLHNFAQTPQFEDDDVVEAAGSDVKRPAPLDVFPGREAHLVLEGPYGGATLRATDYETVLLFAGGSGATFTLGVLDEIIGRCARRGRAEGERTQRVMWCWCVRSFGAINWFAPYLLQIANLAARADSNIQLSIHIFVTCLCDPDAVPEIPGCTVTEERPTVGAVLAGLLTPGFESGSETSSASASTEDLPGSKDKDVEKGLNKGAYTQGEGGIAVFAAGPGSLIREAGNAVARSNLGAGRRAGGVAFCAEAFTV